MRGSRVLGLEKEMTLTFQRYVILDATKTADGLTRGKD